jgi:hypothetical protein
MGWNPFKSEEITRVGTTVSRVINDDSIPNSVQVGMLKSLFNEGNIPDYVMEELVASIGVKAERMYRYAEEHYTYGLPSGEVYSSTQGRAQVIEVLETLEGQEISIEYSHYGAPNALHVGWMKLVDDHAYNYETNQLGDLTTAKGTPVFLKDMVVVVPAARINTVSSQVIEQWGTAACAGVTPKRPNNVGDIRNLIQPSPIGTSGSAEEITLLVTYTWRDNLTVFEGTFSMPMGEAGLANGYFHAKYTVAGVTKFWMYENDAGTYPLLDQVFVDGPAAAGSYFPFTYFRYNKQSTISDTTSQAYKTSSKMVKYLGMEYDTVASAIDENPDIADVEQAMMVFAVPAVSSNAVDCRYLFDYFDNMHSALGGNTSAAALHMVASSIEEGFGGVVSTFFRSAMATNTTVIKDARFQMTLANNGTYKRLLAGSIGNVNTYTSDYGTSYIEDQTTNQDTGLAETQTVPVTVHRYRHQLSPNMYEEILVLGLKMTYNIWGGYTTVGDETDDILLIPIDKIVSQTYSINEREKLYSRSLHFVFNSRTVTKVKWYQQSWFSAVLLIVAVVMTIIYPPSYLVAAGLSGTALVIAAIVINLVVSLVLKEVFKLFVKAFGQDVATLIAIAALVYGGYQLATNGVAGAPTASNMLTLSSGLNQAVLADKFNDLLDDSKQFQLYAEEQQSLIEKANELLENSTILDPFVIFGEKPEEFYNRTVHYGNIGILSIDAISSYVDIALTLPKLNDTLGDELNDNPA